MENMYQRKGKNRPCIWFGTNFVTKSYGWNRNIVTRVILLLLFSENIIALLAV